MPLYKKINVFSFLQTARQNKKIILFIHNPT